MGRVLLIVLLLALVVIPVVEIYTFIAVGGRIGALPTILLTLFTAALGIFLVRLQGFVAMADVQRAMLQGRAPFVEMLSGALLLIAGILLLIPGFVTDAIGFALLVPPLRQLVAALLARTLFRPPPAPPGASGGDRIIEVEVVEVSEPGTPRSSEPPGVPEPPRSLPPRR